MENHISCESIDGFIIVHFHGEINCMNAPLYRKELSQLLDNTKEDFVFDFKDTSFIDSSGIGLVLGRYNQLKNQHRSLILSCLDEVCFHLFELTGMFLIMPYFETIEDIKEGVV